MIVQTLLIKNFMILLSNEIRITAFGMFIKDVRVRKYLSDSSKNRQRFSLVFRRQSTDVVFECSIKLHLITNSLEKVFGQRQGLCSTYQLAKFIKCAKS